MEPGAGLDSWVADKVLPPRSGLDVFRSLVPWADAHGYTQSPRSGLDGLSLFLPSNGCSVVEALSAMAGRWVVRDTRQGIRRQRRNA